MEYIFTVITLFLAELIYFKIADRYNIIDKPNERSSHTSVTLRGGGIIFYIAIIIFFIVSGFQYPWFVLGLTLMSVVSILDDISEVSTRMRLLVHFAAVLLMAFQMGVFGLPWYYLLLTFTIVVGVINAYNFMDGINGITAIYSLVIGVLLLFVNYDVHFIENNFLIYTLLGLAVFAFFNFRNTAKCFAGDVGSIGIAYILLFALGLLILETGNFIYILFLAIYGIDTVWTILRRLILGENILEGHRTHLYQYLSNEVGYNRLKVASAYAIAQLFLGGLVIYISQFDTEIQWWFAIFVVTILSAIYIIIKNYIIDNFPVKKEQEKYNMHVKEANYKFEKKEA
ncbi:glycosyltransferase family 4 protein [Sphingobacterium sp.]|uniref:MraY family glycosyltransferase n=1 Tax=Sphingobacterium sp. TaxID=341027 RepID=UPI002899DFD1|nr:glycosyltransferase family 4 protein [Sphingobacterium sp.]